MPLYLIGLGLGDEKDITLKGYEIVKKCEKNIFRIIHVDIVRWKRTIGTILRKKKLLLQTEKWSKVRAN